MSSVLPPPTQPPQGGNLMQELSLDDLQDRFWTIVQEELESRSASLADDCEGLLRNQISEGASQFLKSSPEKQNLALAVKNLRRLMREMIQVAAAQEKMAATAGGSQPMIILDEEVFYLTLNNAKRKGWTFWPFYW